MITISPHAKERMIERGVSRKKVIRILSKRGLAGKKSRAFYGTIRSGNIQLCISNNVLATVIVKKPRPDYRREIRTARLRERAYRNRLLNAPYK